MGPRNSDRSAGGSVMGRPATISHALLMHVGTHPGATQKAITAALGVPCKSVCNAIARNVAVGNLASSGLMRLRRYFLTAAEAQANPPTVVAAQPLRPYFPPVRPVVLAMLTNHPAGMTAQQLTAATGLQCDQVTSALYGLTSLAQAFVIPYSRRSVFFATASDMEAAREAVAAARVTTAEIMRARSVQRKAAAVARAPAVKAAPKPKPPKPALKRGPKFELNKPAARIRTGPRTGWGPDDPMTITPNTIYTPCPSPRLAGFRSNTHSQF